MRSNAALAILFVAITTAEARYEDNRAQSLDLIRLLSNDKQWIELVPRERWDRQPRSDMELEADTDRDDSEVNDDSAEGISTSYDNGQPIVGAEKRSAVATALNAGRRRRQPAPALGKAVAPYVGVGVLNDVGSFFDDLRDNLGVLALLSPEQRSTLFQERPHVLQAPSAGMSGGGIGTRRLHALRPLRPTGNIRSYNRRSFVEHDGGYPRANNHDPGLLWTGLGRR